MATSNNRSLKDAGKNTISMKTLVKGIPVVGPLTRRIYRTWIHSIRPFENSASYWEYRYRDGGNSGDGSYGKLARFKADVLNKFVREQEIKNVIEYGCGDGNQLALAEYSSYTGFDVSEAAVTRCRDLFRDDPTKAFRLVRNYCGETAQLTLSLDVIFHLVENDNYLEYIRRLFDSSEQYVAIYSSNKNEPIGKYSPHVRHRCFTDWIQQSRANWKLHSYVPNKFPFTGNTKTGSFGDFYLFEKVLP
jgi:SAM-dependent methyltransferase